MPAAKKASSKGRSKVKKVMHEYKHGELRTARGRRKVKNPKQAIAIALHEAGASKYEGQQENRRNLRRTKRKERKGQTGQAAREGKGRAQRTLAEAGASRRTAKSRAGRTRKAKSGRVRG